MTTHPSLFHEVKLATPGTLYLHMMPGRREPFQQFVAAVAERGIARVVCLSPLDEVRELSPAYFEAIDQGSPWIHEHYPITDRSVTGQVASYNDLARKISYCLTSGENVHLHCAPGNGRTGTFAMAIALAMGLTPEEGRQSLKAVGSWPETAAQEALIAALGRQIGQRRPDQSSQLSADRLSVS